MRENCRTDKDDARLRKSSALTALPNLAARRREREDPRVTLSSVEMYPPNRHAERIDNDEPICTCAITDNLKAEPRKLHPATDSPLPDRMYWRREIDDPTLINDKTER